MCPGGEVVVCTTAEGELCVNGMSNRKRDSGSGESNISGIYPAGEGAGYAGGITSAACDGIRAARHVIEKYRPCDD